MSYRRLAALFLAAPMAASAFAAPGPAPRKLGPPLISGASVARTPSAAKGAANINGSAVRVPGASAGATAVSGKR